MRTCYCVGECVAVRSLAHAVFSADEARCRGLRLAHGRQVVVNANQILWPDTPFGLIAQSGFPCDQHLMAPFFGDRKVLLWLPSWRGHGIGSTHWP